MNFYIQAIKQQSNATHPFRARTMSVGIWLLLATFTIGCSEPPQFAVNEVELLKLQYQQPANKASLNQDRAREVVDVLAALFGTPDDPRFPFLLGDSDPAHELIQLENLKKAAGPVSSDRQGEQRGLYREHCSQCHGVSGNGTGPTSAFLNPYPRDFRLGKFKFKSTKLGQPPTDEDLRRTLANGVPGSAMPSFRTLEGDELDALVDYVKYLTIRGRVENKLLSEVALLAPDEKLVDMDWRRAQSNFVADLQTTNSDGRRKQYDDQLSLIVEDVFFAEVDEWKRRQPTTVAEIPAWLTKPDAEFAQRVVDGRMLFSGKANCALCHGPTGMGDGQTENYDDWTNQWVKGANVDPRDSKQCAPFIEAGAFPPRPIRPRNLRLRVYRGGDRYADLFRRIANGIEGTGMPDATALSDAEIWSLVAYVLNLPYESLADANSTSAEAKKK